ncbi:GntR family transcriptional regulator [Streptomyces sp. NPDC051018]|uniref:GntR family transcriptional regulator n=1 Tax=Streptomyces sp. NPDC051018 TaxID=3365639 RepID=UPI0037AF3F57
MPRQLSAAGTTLASQLAQVLRTRIREGRWADSQRLPTEAQLCAEFKVSRVTVRQAIRTLASQGLVTSQHGVGTFILSTDAMVHTGLQELKSITETIREMGLRPSMQYYAKEIRPATAEEAKKFSVPARSEILEIARTISADGTVVAYSQDTMPMWVFGLDFQPRQLTGSVFSYLEKHTNVRPRKAISEVHARNRLAEFWERLALDEHDSDQLFILLDQMQFDLQNRPFMHTRVHFVEGRFSFMVLRVAH